MGLTFSGVCPSFPPFGFYAFPTNIGEFARLHPCRDDGGGDHDRHSGVAWGAGDSRRRAPHNDNPTPKNHTAGLPYAQATDIFHPFFEKIRASRAEIFRALSFVRPFARSVGEIRLPGVSRIRLCALARGCMPEMMEAPYQAITKINWRRTVRYGCLIKRHVPAPTPARDRERRPAGIAGNAFPAFRP